jgi:hypothetical protein
MSGLFGSAILEVALGLFFLYWLLSIICSSIQEMLAGLLKLRSRDLERGIANLVCDPATFEAVMQHPIITAIGNTATETNLVQFLAGRGGVAGRPSYISGRAFSLALLDNLAPVVDAPATLATVRARARELAAAAEPPPAGAAAPEGQPGQTVVNILDQVRATLAERLAVTPASPERQRIQAELEGQASTAAILREALGLAASDPVHRAAVAALETHFGSELYQFARPLAEDDVLRRTIVGSVEGKQRLGRLLLNLIDREVTPQGLAAQLGKLSAVVQDAPKDAGRDALEQALSAGQTVDQIRASLEGLLPSAAAEQAIGIIDAARADLTTLRTSIESWYDEAMEHVSGVYKRRTKTWILYIALLIALPIGADSLRFVSTLYANPTLRDVLVRQAERSVAATPTPVPAPSAPPAQNLRDAQDAAEQLSRFSQLFGFDDHPALLPPQPQTAAIYDWVAWVARRLLGSVVTAFAISLGAPFWFDILQKIVNVRSSGAKSATADTKSSPSDDST